MREFWVNSGLALLDIDDDGGLPVTDDFLRAYLLRPELAPIEESCAAEIQLHEGLLREPTRVVGEQELGLLEDADARENYQLFLRYRKRLLDAPTLQAAYMRIHTDAQKAGRVDIPPLFIDQLTQIILHQALIDEEEPTVLRAAEIWFRPQRVMLDDGRVLLADEDALQAKADPGMGALGRMLASGGLAAGEQTLDVLNADNKAQYYGRDENFDFELDITHGRAGATALGNLIERWVLNMLGVKVKVRTLSQIDDNHWRWHIGLDANGTDLLNRLYDGQSLEPVDLRRLLLLARLDFVDMADQRSDIAGKPVYLALGMDESGLTRFKPQNLLLNLPVADRQ